MKSGRKLKSRLAKMTKVYGLFMVILLMATVAGGAYIFSVERIEPKYQSENYPANNGQQAQNSVLGTYYNYYLDTSPSMLGFFQSGNNNMSMLANILEKLNSNTSNKNFYTCDDQIRDVSEDVFYNSMFSGESIKQYYDNLVDRGNEQENLETALNDLDLSKIFTDTYDNDLEFAQSGAVNMIITDLNFLPPLVDTEYHRALLEKFANSIGNVVGTQNFCIYNIPCQFQGTQNLDNYNRSESANVLESNNSFFVIILAPDNSIYESHINRLERLFNEYQIDYQNQKMELKNSLFENQNEFTVDRQRFVNLNNTTLENFNFDNKSLKKMPGNAVGVRPVTGSSNTAAIRLQVASFELPEYIRMDSENRNEDIIDTVIKIYYPHFFGYQEYTDENIVERNTAYLQWQNDVLWLVFEADFNISAQVPHAWLNKSFYIADIQFLMKKPPYTIPEWINSIHTEEIPEDWSKKINIANFIEILTEKKSEAYESSMTEYQRYMGNLFIYVNQ